ncbi:MAG: CPBP family intramembrane metalloprotease [Chloroflexi bacterium]|nr:CPBP family intramembrane metalloprotease [Chloroflexota bacterium]MCI0578994.1 CPBP family intramembrane metalloprotease [Chloroflexota bacterium]MCI0644781.1 CPBP family intramembrane metalloprotease [Chloroflexota bacterium]MCI0731956.1 CPBP family intramembrane metalloprotease [Chloroflexota bacterium]
MTIGGIEFNLKLTLLVILTTVVPMLDYYGHKITGTKAYDRLIFYFLIPMAILLFLFRERPADYGFRLGNWRTGLAFVLPACAGMAVLLWFLARTPDMQRYYNAKAPDNTAYLLYITAVDLWGWEFIWRGFLLFGLARALGPGPAIFLQAVPFAFMHLGKPELETLTTIFGGAAFGFVAWQSGSFLYPWLIHWFIASFTMLVASGRLG